MSVNRCGGDIFVAQKLLNGANVLSRFEQVCGETVAEGTSAWQAGQAAARGHGDDQEVRRARCDASKWSARREGNSREAGGLGNVNCDEVIRDEHQHEHEQDTKVRGET